MQFILQLHIKNYLLNNIKISHIIIIKLGHDNYILNLL